MLDGLDSERGAWTTSSPTTRARTRWPRSAWRPTTTRPSSATWRGGGQQRHQVGQQRVPRQRLRVLSRRHLRRQHLGEQPHARRRPRPSSSSTSSAPPWAARSSRTRCSSSPTTRARASISPARPPRRSPRPPGGRGDFSSLLATGTVMRDPLTGLPFPNNQIPASPLQPRRPRPARRHAPTTRCPPVRASTTTTRPSSCRATRVHQGDLKLDANLSPSDNVFVRLSFADYDVQTGTQPVVPAADGHRPPSRQHERGRQLDAHLRRDRGERAAPGLQPHAATTRSPSTAAGVGNYNETLGIPGGQRHARPEPDHLDRSSGLDEHRQRRPDSRATNKVYQLSEKLSVSKGRHFSDRGLQLLHTVMDRTYAGNSGVLGRFTVQRAVHRPPLRRLPARPGRLQGHRRLATPGSSAQNRIGVFIQDDFKASSQLTLNLGLRWEYSSPLVESNDRQVNYDLSTGRALFAGESRRAPASPSRPAAPRATTAAWSIPTTSASRPGSASPGRSSEKTVVRGGYGIVQYMEGTGASNRLSQNNPFIPVDRTAQYTVNAGALRTGFDDIAGGTPGHRRHRLHPRLPDRPPAAVHAAVEPLPGAPAHAHALRGGGLRRHEGDPRARVPGHESAAARRPVDPAGAASGGMAGRRAAAAAERPVAPGHLDPLHRLRRQRQLPRAAARRAPAARGGAGVPGLVHLQQGAAGQPRVLRRRAGDPPLPTRS